MLVFISNWHESPSALLNPCLPGSSLPRSSLSSSFAVLSRSSWSKKHHRVVFGLTFTVSGVFRCYQVSSHTNLQLSHLSAVCSSAFQLTNERFVHFNPDVQPIATNPNDSTPFDHLRSNSGRRFSFMESFSKDGSVSLLSPASDIFSLQPSSPQSFSSLTSCYLIPTVIDSSNDLSNDASTYQTLSLASRGSL